MSATSQRWPRPVLDVHCWTFTPSASFGSPPEQSSDLPEKRETMRHVPSADVDTSKTWPSESGSRGMRRTFAPLPREAPATSSENPGFDATSVASSMR